MAKKQKQKRDKKKRSASKASKRSASNASRRSTGTVRIAPVVNIKTPKAKRTKTANRGGAKKMATLEEQYLFGFIDPENGARGPGDGLYATVVAKHRAYGDYTLKTLPIDVKSGLNYSHLNGNWQVDSAASLNGVDNTGVYTDGGAYRNAATNAITFVACPHYPRSYLGATTYPSGTGDALTRPLISRMSSGFVVSKNIMDQPVYSNKWNDRFGVSFENAEAWCKPMPSYDIEPFVNLPTNKNIQKVPGVTDYVSGNLVSMVRHRLVGVKLQVECNAPALTVQGQVVGGDNKTLYGVDPETFQHDNAEGSYVGQAFFGMSFPYSPTEEVFEGKVFSQTRRNLGVLSHGQTYETCFVPASDHIAKWETVAAMRSPLSLMADSGAVINDTTPPVGNTFAFQSWSDMLMNNPMAFLTFTGVPDGVTFRVKTTVAFEYICLNSNPLALMRDSARLNKRFQPDWSAITACCGASQGKNSCCVSGISMCPAVRHGAQAAAGVMARAAGRKPDPTTFAIGADNSALSIKMQAPSLLANTSDAHVAQPDDIVEEVSLAGRAWEGAKSFAGSAYDLMTSPFGRKALGTAMNMGLFNPAIGMAGMAAAGVAGAMGGPTIMYH